MQSVIFSKKVYWILLIFALFAICLLLFSFFSGGDVVSRVFNNLRDVKSAAIFFFADNLGKINTIDPDIEFLREYKEYMKAKYYKTPGEYLFVEADGKWWVGLNLVIAGVTIDRKELGEKLKTQTDEAYFGDIDMSMPYNGEDIIFVYVQDVGKKNFAGSALTITRGSDFAELCKTGSLQQIVDAIKNGEDVNANNIFRATPLMFAASSNSNPEVITALVSAGGNISAKDSERFTPLMYAAQGNSNPEVITALVNAGANVNARAKDGVTSLMEAAANNSNPKVITALIKAGAYVNAKTATDKLPEPDKEIDVRDVEEVIAGFLRANAVNTNSNDGWTPLMRAAESNSNPEVITTLLELGADPKEKNNSGRMAIYYAKKNAKLKNTEALRKLEEMSR
jgi:ankyrin repeat protein